MREDEFDGRLSKAEKRIEEVAADAAAARHLAAAGDRDLADLTARVLATQQAIDGVGVRITGLEGRITGLEVRITGLEGRITGLDGRIDGLEGRVTRLEGRVDANTAAIKANTAAINNLSVQTGERFTQIDRRFAQVDQRFAALETKVDNGFAEIRGRLDQTAAGLDLIVKLLTPGEGSAEG